MHKIKRKREAYKREGISYLMDQNKKREIPTIFPIALIHEKEYKNNSEQNRCERITQKLLNLKSFIDQDEYNDKIYIKEVISLILI